MQRGFTCAMFLYVPNGCWSSFHFILSGFLRNTDMFSIISGSRFSLLAEKMCPLQMSLVVNMLKTGSVLIFSFQIHKVAYLQSYTFSTIIHVTHSVAGQSSKYLGLLLNSAFFSVLHRLKTCYLFQFNNGRGFHASMCYPRSFILDAFYCRYVWLRCCCQSCTTIFKDCHICPVYSFLRASLSAPPQCLGKLFS